MRWFQNLRVKRLLRLVFQLLSLALFGIILWIGGSDAWQQMLTSDLNHLLRSFVLSGIAGMVAATRLQTIANTGENQTTIPWRRFYYLNMSARALGLVIPRSLSVLAGKPVALRTLGVSLKRSVWIVITDNLFDLSLLGLLALPALSYLKGWITLNAFFLLVLILILILTGLWAIAQKRLTVIIKWLNRVPWIPAKLRPASPDISNLLPSASKALKALGLSILLNGVLIGRFYYISCAVELSLPWLIFAASFPITQLSLVLAVTPGGLGLFDASWYGVLLLGGVSHQDALTFVIAQRAYIFVFVLIWAGFSTLLSLTLEGEKGN